jgi:Kinetochore complex Fta4 of Sim4 subunit, or CENP-50
LLIFYGVVVNSLAHHHNKTAYSSHAQRHVAEQIEALYWSAGEIDRAIMVDDALDQGVDLRRPEYVRRSSLS